MTLQWIWSIVFFAYMRGFHAHCQFWTFPAKIQISFLLELCIICWWYNFNERKKERNWQFAAVLGLYHTTCTKCPLMLAIMLTTFSTSTAKSMSQTFSPQSYNLHSFCSQLTHQLLEQLSLWPDLIWSDLRFDILHHSLGLNPQLWISAKSITHCAGCRLLDLPNDRFDLSERLTTRLTSNHFGAQAQ